MSAIKKVKLDEAKPSKPLVTDGTIKFNEQRKPYFSMGEGTHRVPMSMHKANREKLCARLRERTELDADAVLFLQGGEELPVYDTDTNFGFRQESNFQYVFGVKEPGCFGCLRIRDARAVLMVPEMPDVYQVMCGPIKPPAWFQSAYAVDEVMYVHEAQKVVESLGGKELLFLQGDANRDSGLKLPEPEFVGKSAFKVNRPGCQIAWDEINESRLTKSKDEVALLQYANDVSSVAHIEVMRATRAGQREYIAEANFRYQSMLRGCFRVGYDCICPSGRRNSILHYGHPGEPNSELVEQEGTRLHDMGAEYHCYTSDVTCSFPVNGVFTPEQRTVYEAVWAATLAVEMTCKPGVSYKDMHRLCHRVLLTKMKEAGLFVGEVDAMVAADLIGHFMPHGLGHNLGLDVHDVAGYAPGAFRKDDPSIKQGLRLGRELQENMVLTVEPGFYFIDYLLDKVVEDEKLSKFVNMDRLKQLWNHTGGVRIEDNVVITADGCRVLTNVPRTVCEIEGVMAGAPWVLSAGCCREYSAPGYEF